MAVLVFDGDDTLWMNGWQYSAAQAEFLAYVYTVFGDRSPDLHTLKNCYFKNADELFRSWGVKRGRVAEEMERTYREMCAWIKERFGEDLLHESHIEHIRELGDHPFDYTKLRWLPEARELLIRLKREGHIICLLSSYDVDVFPGRARFLELYEFFQPELVRATEQKKTGDDFIAVSGWAVENDGSTNWYAVGNAKSDILPALEISERWRGIYVPFGTTSSWVGGIDKGGFSSSLETIHTRTTTIASLRDFPKII